MRIAIATCKDLPEPDVDEVLLRGALKQRGAEVRMLPWDAEEAKPDELVVLRSTWNYFEDVDRFLAWIDRTAKTTRLLNPAEVVRGNVRKTYLADLERRGIAIVPTLFTTPGTKIATAWNEVVIKPTVSAGSFLTQRFDLRSQITDAQRFLDDMKRDAMIQQWMPSVETYGERSLVWIGGALSHAIRKSPRFRDGSEKVSEEVAIAGDERAFAERILAPLTSEILYARVDVVRDGDVLRLMELELVEPSLFLKQCPRALDRLVDAILA